VKAINFQHYSHQLTTITVIFAVSYNYFLDTSHLNQAQFRNKLYALEMGLEISGVFRIHNLRFDYIIL